MWSLSSHMTHSQNATTCFIFKLRQFKDELHQFMQHANLMSRNVNMMAKPGVDLLDKEHQICMLRELSRIISFVIWTTSEIINKRLLRHMMSPAVLYYLWSTWKVKRYRAKRVMLDEKCATLQLSGLDPQPLCIIRFIIRCRWRSFFDCISTNERTTSQLVIWLY